MKKTLAFVSSVFLISSLAVSYAADTTAASTSTSLGSIAIVNVQQILQQSPKIASINKNLQDEFKDRQQKLLAQQKALQDEADKFKQESPTMSSKDKEAMQKKLNTEQSGLVKQVTAFQQDLNKEQNKQMQGVLGQLNTIITGIAKKNSYSVVLDAQAVIYAKDSSQLVHPIQQNSNFSLQYR